MMHNQFLHTTQTTRALATTKDLIFLLPLLTPFKFIYKPKGIIIFSYIIFFLFINGCTIVKISGEKPKIKLNLGVTNISIQNENTEPTVIISKSLGLIKTPNSLSIGYINEVLSKFPNNNYCSLIIFVETNEELDSIKKILLRNSVELNSLCTISKDGNSWLLRKET